MPLQLEHFDLGRIFTHGPKLEYICIGVFLDDEMNIWYLGEDRDGARELCHQDAIQFKTSIFKEKEDFTSSAVFSDIDFSNQADN